MIKRKQVGRGLGKGRGGDAPLSVFSKNHIVIISLKSVYKQLLNVESLKTLRSIT